MEGGRYYAENSEYPRVIDRRDGYAVKVFGAYDYDSAKNWAEMLNSGSDDEDDERSAPQDGE